MTGSLCPRHDRRMLAPGRELSGRLYAARRSVNLLLDDLLHAVVDRFSGPRRGSS